MGIFQKFSTPNTKVDNLKLMILDGIQYFESYGNHNDIGTALISSFFKTLRLQISQKFEDRKVPLEAFEQLNELFYTMQTD